MMERFGLGCALLVCILVGARSLDFGHHDEIMLGEFMTATHLAYPNLTKLYSIGQSVYGVDLWVMAIGKDIDSYVELRPHVKYIGNMHGNEVVSREVLLHLIDYYVTQYATNATIQGFLDSTVVHIMPTMNPDGYNISWEGDCTGVHGRYNANETNLNRNFPDIWHDRQEKPIATETQHVIDWLYQYNFILSANLHGGAMVANYPFDQYTDRDQKYGPSVCPDDDIFRYLSLVYARSHATMARLNGTECKGDYFLDGVTNGADWYAVSGGMQDYNYLVHGIFEVTLEIACCKYPVASELPSYWQANKEALVNYLLESHRGVKGIITDENNNTMSGAQLYIVGRELVPFSSRLHGEYYRILVPGQYTLKVSADSYLPTTRQFTVTEGVTRVDIQLTPDSDPTGGAATLHQGTLLLLLSLIAAVVLS